MVKSHSESPTVPLGARLALIALLPLLALAVYLDGQRYNSDLVNLEPGRSGQVPSPSLFPDTLADLHRAGQVRNFDRDNLYQYVDGHAEYFIGAGFRGLAVGEYGDTGDGQPALVVNLYDMGAPLNAFGVLVDEAGDQEAVDVGSMGFRSGQGLSFIQGRYYVQMSRFDKALSADDAAAELATGLAVQVKDPGLAFQFPDLGRVISTRFVKESYHGLEFLNQVLERGFERNDKELRVFLLQGSEAEIGELVGRLEAFFAEDEMPYRRVVRNDLVFFLIDDPYEGKWFFVPMQKRLLGAFTPLDETLIATIEKYAGNK